MSVTDHIMSEAGAMGSNYVMKVTANGQVSIPAPTRARWNADRVLVVDLGDHIVLRPVSSEPVEDLRGKYRRIGPSTDRIRRSSRADDTSGDRRR